jgi:hypothetical protein
MLTVSKIRVSAEVPLRASCNVDTSPKTSAVNRLKWSGHTRTQQTTPPTRDLNNHRLRRACGREFKIDRAISKIGRLNSRDAGRIEKMKVCGMPPNPLVASRDSKSYDNVLM